MSLKPVVDNLEAVPEALRSFYTESDGKFRLSVDGMVSKDRLDEFRTNNVKLSGDLEKLQNQFKGIDPEKARELMTRAQLEADKKLIEAGKVDELLEQRTAAMRQSHESALQAVASERDTLKGQINTFLVDGSLRDAAAKEGVRAAAIDDVLLRGRQIFRVQDGKAVAMEGDKPMFGSSGDALSVSEWMKTLRTAAGHLFEESKGGGAQGSGSGAGGANTMTRREFEALSPAERAVAVKSKKIVD